MPDAARLRGLGALVGGGLEGDRGRRAASSPTSRRTAPTRRPPGALPEPAALGRAAGRRRRASRRGSTEAVAPGDLQTGDVVVRVARRRRLRQDGDRRRATRRQRVVLDTMQGRASGRTGAGDAARPPTRCSSTAEALRPEAAAYRIAVKKDSTLGHVRELDARSRPPRAHHRRAAAAGRPKGRRGAVDDKVHELIDEAWSLMPDKPFEDDGRALTGRALALAAALDWPGAAEQAAAVLDDVLKRTPDARRRRGRARQRLPAGRASPTRRCRWPRRRRRCPDVAAARRATSSGARCWPRARQDDGLAAIKRYLRGRPGRPARQAAWSRRGGRRAGAGAAAPKPDRRGAALLGDAGARPAAQRGVRLQHRLAAHLAGRRPAGRARDRAHRRARDRPRAARRRRGRARRGVSLLVQRPRRREAAALAQARARATCSPTPSSRRCRR